MPKAFEHRLIEKFKDKKYFSREELFNFFRYFEPDLKEGTFAWRIYDLKNRNIIRPLKRGLYVISHKPIYTPGISPGMLKFAKQLSQRFDEIKLCLWDTAWLNEFAQHQTSRSMLFIEIEKGFVESLFYELKDAKHREVFLNPDKNVIDFYIAESNRPIIIKKLLSRAPISRGTGRVSNFYIPTLEKILVDLYADEKLFHYVQGSELIHIYENALSRYSINFTKLFNYAKRREREQGIKQYITNHMFHLVKNFIDD